VRRCRGDTPNASRSSWMSSARTMDLTRAPGDRPRSSVWQVHGHAPGTSLPASTLTHLWSLARFGPAVSRLYRRSRHMVDCFMKWCFTVPCQGSLGPTRACPLLRAPPPPCFARRSPAPLTPSHRLQVSPSASATRDSEVFHAPNPPIICDVLSGSSFRLQE
jgi:hypothetical protein